MGITNSNKEINLTQIECGGNFNVTLALTAEPDITNNPVDIVLILDRSRSMAGSALANLKNGAKKFIDIIDESTDSSQDGQIGGGSHIGIVSFATTATQDTALITSVATLKTAVDNLTANGSTNHADAFTKAIDLFDPNSTNEKIMVMFTDGFTTAGVNPDPIAQAAKDDGIIIYCIGLSGNGGISEDSLNEWASDPDSAYVAITPNDEELEDLFEDLAKNISNPGATNIVLTDYINQCFKIISNNLPSKGTATIINENTIQWKINELGTTTSEGATLTFMVEHLGNCSGDIKVNNDIDYIDDEGNIVNFPDPTIEVKCDDIIIVEDCPTPQTILSEGCQDTFEFDAGDIELESTGRILKLDVKVKNICPHKRVALAIILNELDENNIEYPRGLKTLIIPAHERETCQDVLIKCVKFVLPDNLEEICPTTMCNQRVFNARFIAHYIDHDFNCCDLT